MAQRSPLAQNSARLKGISRARLRQGHRYNQRRATCARCPHDSERLELDGDGPGRGVVRVEAGELEHDVRLRLVLVPEREVRAAVERGLAQVEQHARAERAVHNPEQSGSAGGR